MSDAAVQMILVVTGAITAGALMVTFFPGRVLASAFGAGRVDAPTLLVARHWGLLVALVGGLLIYAGYHPEIRVPVMIAAIVEKFAIGALVFASPFRRKPAAVVAGADSAIAVLYVVILATGAR